MPREGAVLVYCAPGSGHAAPLRVTQAVTIFRTVTLLSLVCRSRTLQDCSDRVLAEPDMAADQPVAQTSLCQLEDLLRLAVRGTLSWLAAEPLTAGLGGGDSGDAPRRRPQPSGRGVREIGALPRRCYLRTSGGCRTKTALTLEIC